MQEAAICKTSIHTCTTDTKNRLPGKIAILGTLPPIRGLSSYCLELSVALADIIEIGFISFHNIYPAFIYPGGKLDEDRTFPPFNHPYLKVRRRLTWYNPVTWLREGIDSDKELLHVQWWSLPLFPVFLTICASFKARGKPVVITVHNVMPHEKSRVYQKLSSILFKLADHFIVHTRLNKKQLTTYYGIQPEMVSVIPHGTLDFFVKKDLDCDLIRSEMGFNSRNKVLLLFGSIRQYKGIDTALKAFAKIVDKIPEARLLIAGKLWQSWQPYKRLISDLGIERFVSTHLEYIPADDINRYFSTADMVLLPYHHFDSQSGAGSTAVAFRKPLIVSNVGGLPDLVNDQRLVVPPMNSTALADTIINCLDTPGQLEDMAADADIVAKKMMWPDIAVKTCTIYRNLLD
ncbi:glycosyltransferase, partial [Thermodesulfobacteriota bacterium]